MIYDSLFFIASVSPVPRTANWGGGDCSIKYKSLDCSINSISHRGGKKSIYEGAVKSPTLIHAPSLLHEKGNTRDALIHITGTTFSGFIIIMII